MSQSESLQPSDVSALCDAIRDAGAAEQRLEIRGGGSKRDFGAPREEVTLLEMNAFTGVVDYDPPELVITVGAATPLHEVEALVHDQGQMLAFEPMDHGPIYGRDRGCATVGGVIAASAAGSRRLAHGSVRDHFLGFEAVSGRGEHFVAGGRVVKNVTGYDLPKLMAGSWGRLVALTQVTLKVLPRPRELATLCVTGLSAEQAMGIFSAMLGAGSCVAAAAHVPATASENASVTALRLEGFAPSVQASTVRLEALVPKAQQLNAMTATEAETFWTRISTLSSLDRDVPLWRIATPPGSALQLTGSLERLGTAWLWDWAGGLTWASTVAPAATVREAAASAHGHAVLVRAAETMRRSTPTFHPQQPAVMRLEERVRRSFDPLGVFENGRFAQADHEN